MKQPYFSLPFDPPLIYRGVFILLSPLVMGYTLWRSSRDGGWRYFLQRLGLGIPQFSASNDTVTTDTVQNQPEYRLWIHAASVGEVITVLPLIQRALNNRHNNQKPGIVVTTNTPTGAAILAQQALPHVTHQYLPLDFSGACQRFFRHLKEDGKHVEGWIVETEIWPWLYAKARWHGIPLTIINARLSKRTLRYSDGISGLILRRALTGVTILARSQQDADLYQHLGAEPKRIHVTGNLKYASAQVVGQQSTANSPIEKPSALLPERLYVIAASTHDDEELQLAVSWTLALAADNNKPSVQHDTKPLLVIVPRHPERAASITTALSEHHIQVAQRSLGQQPHSRDTVYLADTLGELQNWYPWAAACFVGGSLIEHGGHNVLEPARAGCPAITGPHTFNFADIVVPMCAAQALKTGQDAQAVVAFLLSAAENPEQYKTQAEHAKIFAQSLESVLDRYTDALVPAQQ